MRETRTVTVEFLYLDTEVCTRCGGTGGHLAEAIERVTPAYEALGIGLERVDIHVTGPELAVNHRFLSSPTIRVDGRDIAGDLAESECGDCGRLGGLSSVECREWRWRGETFTAAPTGLIVEALLRAAVDEPVEADEAPYTLPDNLRRFFEARADGTKRTCC